MRSPADMQIIQIELTNACPRRCSNCTRLVAHQRRPFFLDAKTMQRAVESLQGYNGTVGIMGGEPTIHPNFDRLVRQYRDVVDPGRRYASLRQPVSDFARYRQQHLSSLDHRRGLWTSLGPGYYRHLELISETFGYQCVNDHSHAGTHQALLMARRDLGIPDDIWIAKRDACWLQNLWSASITPAGAYFCEVAAAIDWTFHGGHAAWPIEPGWWRRQPADFADQVHLCEYCSACLDVPRRVATEEIDDVSPGVHRQLVQLGSPAIRRGRVAVRATPASRPAWVPTAENYMIQPDGHVDNLARIAPANRSVYPQRLDALTVCVGRADVLRCCLQHNRRHFDRYAVVTTPADLHTQRVARQLDCDLVVSDRVHAGQAAFNKGALLNDGWGVLQPKDWVLLTDCDILLPPTLRDWLDGHVLNPGCLYYTTRYHARSIPQMLQVRRDWAVTRGLWRDTDGADRMPWGYFQLFHAKASAIAGRDSRAPFSEVFFTAGSVDHHWMVQWPAERHVRVDDETRNLSIVHIWHGPPANAWHAGFAAADRWTIAGVTAGDKAWHTRAIEYPCWVRLVRVSSAEAITRYCRTSADGPVIAQRGHVCHFGFAGQLAGDVEIDAGRTGWGLGRDVMTAKQGYAWRNAPTGPSQYDLYQIRNLADESRAMEPLA